MVANCKGGNKNIILSGAHLLDTLLLVPNFAKDGGVKEGANN